MGGFNPTFAAWPFCGAWTPPEPLMVGLGIFHAGRGELRLRGFVLTFI